MRSRPSTVAEYLAALPPERRAAIETVRAEINRRLPAGYEEGIAYGMIGWCVPHSRFPAGYHCDPSKPLGLAALASQKGYMSLHLMSIYGSAPLRQWFEAEWRKRGKKLDMGKACVRFKKLEDLALDVIGEAIRRKKYVAFCEAALQSMKRRRSAGKARPRPASKPGPRAKSRRPARKTS